MSIQAKQLRPYLSAMGISPEAKRLLTDALATEESFIILRASECANKVSGAGSVVQLAQQDFDVIVTPSVLVPLKELFDSPEMEPPAIFNPMLIVHPDEPGPDV